MLLCWVIGFFNVSERFAIPAIGGLVIDLFNASMRYLELLYVALAMVNQIVRMT